MISIEISLAMIGTQESFLIVVMREVGGLTLRIEPIHQFFAPDGPGPTKCLSGTFAPCGFFFRHPGGGECLAKEWLDPEKSGATSGARDPRSRSKSDLAQARTVEPSLCSSQPHRFYNIF
jgi:hypothetical protein